MRKLHIAQKLTSGSCLPKPSLGKGCIYSLSCGGTEPFKNVSKQSHMKGTEVSVITVTCDFPGSGPPDFFEPQLYKDLPTPTLPRKLLVSWEPTLSPGPSELLPLFHLSISPLAVLHTAGYSCRPQPVAGSLLDFLLFSPLSKGRHCNDTPLPSVLTGQDGSRL